MARSKRPSAIGWLDHLDPEKVRNIYIENEADFDTSGDMLVAGILTREAQKYSNVVINHGTLRNWRSQRGLVVFKKHHRYERIGGVAQSSIRFVFNEAKQEGERV